VVFQKEIEFNQNIEVPLSKNLFVATCSVISSRIKIKLVTLEKRGFVLVSFH